MGPSHISNWRPHYQKLWGRVPLRLEHNLSRNALFDLSNLASLIEAYPRQHYSIVSMGPIGAAAEYKSWSEGEIGDLKGDKVIEAINNGRLWLNLRQVNLIDKRFQLLLDEVIGELQTYMPEFRVLRSNCGILISSPRAQVYFHVDLPGQMLFQIAGTKTLYFYPSCPPFLYPEDLERIAIYGVEVDIPYSLYYDEYARIYKFQPGEMFTWPLNAPHRIENASCLNISMTVEFITKEIRRNNILARGNGMVRYQLGWRPRKAHVYGPGFWTKAIVQKTLRPMPWIKARRLARRKISFCLDTKRLGNIFDISRS